MRKQARQTGSEYREKMYMLPTEKVGRRPLVTKLNMNGEFLEDREELTRICCNICDEIVQSSNNQRDRMRFHRSFCGHGAWSEETIKPDKANGLVTEMVKELSIDTIMKSQNGVNADLRDNAKRRVLGES